MKRKATDSIPSAAKRRHEAQADYCDTPCRVDEEGKQIWPASMESIESARAFLKSW